MLQWLASVVWKIIVLTLAVYYSAWMIFISSISWLKYSLQFWGAPVRHKTPEGLNDKRFKHGYAKLQNGIKLHYAEAGDQTKPLMLCLHGFPEFWYSWRYQMQEFSKDFWVVAVDMRGYGDSDKPEGIQNYHMSKLLEDVKLLPTALGRTKIDVLLAHDWGGAIAWTFVATNPEMVGIYIPMNIPHPSAFQEYIKGSWVQFRKSWYIFFFQMPYLPEWAWRLNDFEWLRTCFTNPKTKAPVISEEDLNAYKNTFSKPDIIQVSQCLREISLRNDLCRTASHEMMEAARVIGLQLSNGGSQITGGHNIEYQRICCARARYRQCVIDVVNSPTLLPQQCQMSIPLPTLQ
ncbi:unnamed protein product, partial [Cyprideis torosa]